MSEQEYHVGKLRKVDTLEYTIEDFMKYTLVNDGKWDEEYADDIEELFKDVYYRKYFIVGKDIYEFVEHQEPDPYDDINEYKRNEDGTISFITKFYNGGTCLSEMVEEGLEKLLKSEA